MTHCIHSVCCSTVLMDTSILYNDTSMFQYVPQALPSHGEVKILRDYILKAMSRCRSVSNSLFKETNLGRKLSKNSLILFTLLRLFGDNVSNTMGHCIQPTRPHCARLCLNSQFALNSFRLRLWGRIWHLLPASGWLLFLLMQDYYKSTHHPRPAKNWDSGILDPEEHLES